MTLSTYANYSNPTSINKNNSSNKYTLTNKPPYKKPNIYHKTGYQINKTKTKCLYLKIIILTISQMVILSQKSCIYSHNLYSLVDTTLNHKISSILNYFNKISLLNCWKYLILSIVKKDSQVKIIIKLIYQDHQSQIYSNYFNYNLFN